MYDYNAAVGNPIPTPFEQQGQLNQLLAQRQQQQMGQQQLQGAQMENQQRQMDIDSQKALMRAYTEAGGNIDQAVPLAAKYGAKPDALLKLKMAGIEQQKAALELVSAKGARAGQEADWMQGAHDSVTAAPQAQKDIAYKQALQGLQQRGVDISQMPQQYPGDQAFQYLGAVVQGHKDQVEQALKAAQTAEAVGKGAQAQAEAAKVQQETGFGPTGPAAEAKYRFILSKAAGGQQLSDNEISFAKGFEASNRKTTSQSDSLGVTSVNSSAPAGLASVLRRPISSGGGNGAPVSGGASSNPQSLKNSIVDMVGQYKMNPTMIQRLIVKHPDVIAQVQQKYPDFDQTTYQAKNKLISNYTSGPQSREINAINTVMGHLAALDDAGTALKNGDIQLMNKLANAVGVQVGQNPATTYRMIAHRVAPELAQAYIQGGGGEGERQAIAQDFSDSMSPDQIHPNIAKSVVLLRSKIGSLENQYKQSVGRDDFQQRFITPDAQRSLQRFAPESGGGAGMVQVQIPGHAAGRIPARALQQFQKDHPNAQVIR